MADKWMILGKEYTNCNCAYGCPCQFNSPATHGFCEAMAGIRIDEGRFNDVRLDGLSFVMTFHWPGQIAEGNGESQLIIDERADKAQREAIRKISHGESTKPGATHFFIFNSTVTKVHETLYRPVELSIDIEARRAQVRIDGLVESQGTPQINPFTKKESRKGIYLPEGFEYIYAEAGSGVTRTKGAVKLDFKDTYGQFCVLHMNQDGVIRPKKLPF